MHYRSKLWVVGNWKMNCNCQEAINLITFIQKNFTCEGNNVEVVFCPPFTLLYLSSQIIKKNIGFRLGAQNIYPKDYGAVTGEISPLMIKDVGCDYVIIGHSERRRLLNESDKFINMKVKIALAHNLKVILCIGEEEEERLANREEEVTERQLREALEGIDESDVEEKLFLAYEPVWAIGTGRVATPQVAASMHSFIRRMLSSIYKSTDLGDKVPILYGGSVTDENILDLLIEEELDGVLVGGASILPSSFLNIIRVAHQIITKTNL
jgi:triosephosphate isomerase